MVKNMLEIRFAIFWSAASHILSIHLQMINQGHVCQKLISRIFTKQGIDKIRKLLQRNIFDEFVTFIYRNCKSFIEIVLMVYAVRKIIIMILTYELELALFCLK